MSKESASHCEINYRFLFDTTSKIATSFMLCVLNELPFLHFTNSFLYVWYVCWLAVLQVRGSNLGSNLFKKVFVVISVCEAVRCFIRREIWQVYCIETPLHWSLSMKLYDYCIDTPQQYSLFTVKLSQCLSILYCIVLPLLK